MRLGVPESLAQQTVIIFYVCFHDERKVMMYQLKNERVKVCTSECYTGYIISTLLPTTEVYSLENSGKNFFAKPLRNTPEKGVQASLLGSSITRKTAFICYSLEVNMRDAAIPSD